MSYVALTPSNVNLITGCIDQMMHAELNAAGLVAAPPAPTLTSNDRYINMLWGEYLHLKGQVPDHWLEQVDRLDMHVKSSDGHAVIEIQCPMKPAVPLPPVKGRSYYSHDYRDVNVALDDERFAPHRHWLDQRTEVANRWNKIKSQITEFLSKCKSLNEAVKLYPDVMLYVPKSLKDRLGNKVEKKARDVSEALAALAKVETDVVTTSAVLARMAGQKL